MIQDNDEQTLERVREEIYDSKYADESILQLMNKAYHAILEEPLTLNGISQDCRVVEVHFRLMFEQPIKRNDEVVREFECSVGFYAYEYKDMLDSMKSGASLKLSAYRSLGLNPIVEKTKNNFTAKAREKGIYIRDIRDVRFLVTEV